MIEAKLKNILAMLIFGTIGVFVKNIELSSSEIALTRGIIGGSILLIFIFLTKEKISIISIKNNLKILCFSGFAVGINWIFLFQSYRYTTISNATLSYYFAPVFVTIFSPIILKEKLNFFKVICIFMALIGMGFIVGVDGITNKRDFIGIIYGLLAAGFYASVILSNKFLKDIRGIEITVVQLFVSALTLLPYVLAVEGNNILKVSSSSIPYILILGIIHTGIAYLLYFSSIQKLKAQTVAVLSYIDPVFAVIISGFLLKEPLGFSKIIGGILILGSNFMNEFLNRK
ncbi:MAG: DMT family transporter [Fusobacterium perfoetens]|uniref:DMT family transporter n=1 Tax=Fusobacterium perfoetens TaxID=852 RepID=UPI0023F1C29A|nr:DMT family transporter [Fusobacterium perfoetens]MCI6153251.1 DMT family transporter [Fusobacterium perfoetens]MDY3238352.1 DMT family transporter [Fusobacterium perfoetens]